MNYENDQTQNLASLIAQYLDINMQGGGNPMYTSPDAMGVKEKGMDISGNVQANIPMDKLINDAIVSAPTIKKRLQAPFLVWRPNPENQISKGNRI